VKLRWERENSLFLPEIKQGSSRLQPATSGYRRWVTSVSLAIMFCEEYKPWSSSKNEMDIVCTSNTIQRRQCGVISVVSCSFIKRIRPLSVVAVMSLLLPQYIQQEPYMYEGKSLNSPSAQPIQKAKLNVCVLQSVTAVNKKLQMISINDHRFLLSQFPFNVYNSMYSKHQCNNGTGYLASFMQYAKRTSGSVYSGGRP